MDFYCWIANIAIDGNILKLNTIMGEKEKMEKLVIAKKYEKDFFQCGECKFNGGMAEVTDHGYAKKHYERMKPFGKREYVPTIEEAQGCGDVIFENGKRRHNPCNEYLIADTKKDKKNNIVSIDFLCKKCGQKFQAKI